jgi:putative acetyltransferase
MQLREYKSADCEQLAELFYQTVHSINAKDYTKEQLDAWATGKVDLQQWDKSFKEHKTIVGTENGEIVGFGDIDKSGYLDRLYVHRDYQRRGIASAICDELESSVRGKQITTHASITAKPFFEYRGYHVVKEQEVIRHGIALTNYVMKK